MRSGNWCTLDNSAKIMPSMTNNLKTNVFRLTCSLKEDVNASLLDDALSDALKEFPMFLYVMKSGFFWHYLEKTDRIPKVELESTNPCEKIDNGFLFRLSYYKKRINLEVYHVLADGRGALEFLKYIVACYLNKKYAIKCDDVINESSEYEKESDDFKKFDKSKYKIKLNKSERAYKLKFQKKDDAITDVIEVHMNVKDIKDASKKFKTTVTIYLIAVYIKSIITNARVKDLNRPIGITVPIDLRNAFPSKTSRNFFYTISIYYKSDGIDKLENIVGVVDNQLKEKLRKEKLQELLDTYMVTQKLFLIRLVPSFLKDFILSKVYKIAQRGETSVLSNVGVVSLPSVYEKHIEYFTGLMSTNDMQLTVVSFKEEIVLSFTSHFVSKEIERTMIKFLSENAKSDIKIISNIVGDNND